MSGITVNKTKLGLLAEGRISHETSYKNKTSYITTRPGFCKTTVYTQNIRQITMNELYLIGGMTLATFTIRYAMFAVSGRVKLPDKLVRALRYVPPAVLTAITVPAVLIPTGSEIVFSYTNARLVGALVAFGVGWFSKNLLLTILLGMIAFFCWQWLLVTGLAHP